MLTGKYVELSWDDVMAAVHEKHGGDPQGTWYTGGFVPPSICHLNIIRIQLIDPHPFSETCGCKECCKAIREGRAG